MSRRCLTVALVLVLSAGGTLLALPAFAGGGGHCEDADQSVSSSDSVVIRDSCFNATITKVDVGEKITFTNRDIAPHNVVGWSMQWGHMDTLERGEGFSVSFDEPGVYPFACYLHSGMVGAVVAGDGYDAGAVSGITRGTDTRPAVAERDRDESPSSGRVTLTTALGGALLVAVLAAALVITRRRGRPASRPA